MTIPAAASPAVMDSCDTGQSGEVLFIPHTYLGNQLQTTCTMRNDQSMLASGGGSFCDTATGAGKTDEELIACVQADHGTFGPVSVTVDGQPVEPIDAYWVMSDPFEFQWPEGNLFDAPVGPTRGVAAGWFVMLSGLTPGSHTVVVHDEVADAYGAMQVAEVVAQVEVTEGPAPSASAS